MGSYIEEFQEDREKNSDIIITIDGPSGAGKGTLGRHIAEELGITYYSAGDFFREIAEEKGMTVEELSQEADKDIDVQIDRRTLEKGLNESCVIESRIASRVLGGYSDLKIYLTADLDERARRAMGDKGRKAEEHTDSVEEKKRKVKERDRNNDERYERYYGIDMDDREIYDVIIDNTDLGIEEQNQLTDKVLKESFPERYGDE